MTYKSDDRIATKDGRTHRIIQGCKPDAKYLIVKCTQGKSRKAYRIYLKDIVK